MYIAISFCEPWAMGSMVTLVAGHIDLWISQLVNLNVDPLPICQHIERALWNLLIRHYASFLLRINIVAGLQIQMSSSAGDACSCVGHSGCASDSHWWCDRKIVWRAMRRFLTAGFLTSNA